MLEREGRSTQTPLQVRLPLRDAPWTSAGALLALALLTLIGLFNDSVRPAIEQWLHSSAFNHCFLIIPISLYLVWEKRGELAVLTPRPDYRGIILVAIFAVAWLAASAADISEGEQFAVVGMMQATIFAIFGFEIARVLILPILYLWLLVPTGGFLLPALQKIAADQTELLLQLSSIPIYRDGLVLTVPTGSYVIEAGCAGLNFLLSAVALAPLYGFLIYRRWAKRLIAFALAVLAAIVANGVRIYGIIALAEFTDRRIDIVDDHLLYGWGFFSLVILLMGFVGLYFADTPEKKTTVLPSGRLEFPFSRMIGVALAALTVAGSALAYGAVSLGAARESGTLSLRLPTPGAGWRESAAASDWRIDFPGAQDIVHKRYDGARCCVDVNIGYYWSESEDGELIANENAIADRKKWQISVRERHTVVTHGDTITINTAILSTGMERRIVWYWYWVDGRFTPSSLIAKLLQAKAALLWGDTRSAIIAVSAAAGSDGDAEGLMTDYLAASGDLAYELNATRLLPQQTP